MGVIYRVIDARNRRSFELGKWYGCTSSTPAFESIASGAASALDVLRWVDGVERAGMVRAMGESYKHEVAARLWAFLKLARGAAVVAEDNYDDEGEPLPTVRNAYTGEDELKFIDADPMRDEQRILEHVARRELAATKN